MRLPEGCGILWLALLAGAIWIHTHASQQLPIYDSFGYYQKAYNFWMAIRTGKWFNPLDLEPTYRPPGTILMSYPTGFDPDPRAFYFRSVYLPGVLLFSSVLIAVYEVQGEVRLRWRAILTAIFFTTMTLLYHFEFGTWGGYWGLVDGFLTGIAAIAAACVWRGTRRNSKVLIWAASVSLASALSIVVKPSGALVAATAGLAWVGFALSTLIEIRSSFRMKLALTLRLTAGAGMIGLLTVLVIMAALLSGYLSRNNLAYGEGSIAILKAQFRIPPSQLWDVVNTGIGDQFLLWGISAVAICAMASFSAKGVATTATQVASAIASLATFLFGIWFWLIGTGGGYNIRYGVPFFMMAMIWLLPTTMRGWDLAPMLLKRFEFGLMIVAPLNLALVLLVARPSLSWQKLSGVGITAEFPPQIFAAFKRLIDAPSGRPISIYVMSFDANDAILDSLVSHERLFRFGGPVLSLRRPVDWIRPSTFRIREIASANILVLNPRQAKHVAAGQIVNDLDQEVGVFTAWADGLTVADGVSVYLATSSAKILNVVDPARLRASLDRLVANHSWDPVFALANHLPGY